LPVHQTPTERSTLGPSSHFDPAIELGAVSTHPLGGHEQYPVAAAAGGRDAGFSGHTVSQRGRRC